MIAADTALFTHKNLVSAHFMLNLENTGSLVRKNML